VCLSVRMWSAGYSLAKVGSIWREYHAATSAPLSGLGGVPVPEALPGRAGAGRCEHAASEPFGLVGASGGVASLLVLLESGRRVPVAR